MANETRCIVCNDLTVARQYIRLVPMTPAPTDDDPNAMARGEPMHAHLRHAGAEVVGAMSADAAAPTYKVNYNPPQSLTRGAMYKVVVNADVVAETIDKVRDAIFKWLLTVPAEMRVQAVTANSCADDGALPDFVKLMAAKPEHEILERCLQQSVLVRLKAQMDAMQTAAA